MSEFNTVDQDTMICPYCGHDLGLLLGSGGYEICNKCDKPFKVDVIITKLNEHWPHEYKTSTEKILGVM